MWQIRIILIKAFSKFSYSSKPEPDGQKPSIKDETRPTCGGCSEVRYAGIGGDARPAQDHNVPELSLF